MKEMVRDMFYDNVDGLKDKKDLTSMEIAAIEEFDRHKKLLTKKEAANIEDEQFKELVNYYKKLELEDDLLFTNYANWSLIPSPIRRQIDIDLKPLYFSGVCVCYSKLVEKLDSYLTSLDKADYSVCIYKYHTHYRLSVIYFKRKHFAQTRLSARDIREFNEYVAQNIVYQYGLHV